MIAYSVRELLNRKNNVAMLERYLKYCGVLLFVFVSCFRETPVEVSADFEIEVVNDDYSVPVTIRVTNKTAGADLYAWTFEGGEPATSNKYHPDEIIYNRAGKYLLRLEAWNTTERKTKELTLALDSVIHAYFSYQVKMNCFSPVKADFTNNSYGGNEYYWE
ncbi:MAG: PKD domain-containing protein, partial [Odoribacter sp.]|nr:PKD domain-containing protein [Odoribacter sp.]